MKKEVNRKEIEELFRNNITLCSFNAKSDVSLSQLFSTVVGGVFGLFDNIKNEFELFLIKDFLYIKEKDFENLTIMERANNDELININDIDFFKVKNIESKHVVQIKTNEKEIFFWCEKEEEIKNALIMEKLIIDLKEII